MIKVPKMPFRLPVPDPITHTHSESIIKRCMKNDIQKKKKPAENKYRKKRVRNNKVRGAASVGPLENS